MTNHIYGYFRVRFLIYLLTYVFFLFLFAFLYLTSIFAQNQKFKSHQEERSLSVTEVAKQRQNSLQKQLNQDAEARYRYADLLFTEGQYERAQELWEQFILLFPNHAQRLGALYHLGVIADRQSRFDEAMNYYMRAYQQNPSRDLGLQAYLQAGRLALRMGNISQARGIFTSIVKEGKFSRFAKVAETELKAFTFDNST